MTAEERQEKRAKDGTRRGLAANAPIEAGILFVERSQNGKLSRDHKVSVTMAARDTCPSDCPMWNACYAAYGKQGFQTRRLAVTGPHNPTVLAQREADAIRKASGKYPLRLHIVGDAKTREGVRILAEACEEYRDRHNQPVWTYTHVHHIERALWKRVSVLRSCHTLGQIRRAHRDGYAATLVVDRFQNGSRAWREDGFTFIPCPAQTGDRTCVECGLCMKDRQLHANRSVIVFEAHGMGAKLVRTDVPDFHEEGE